MKENYEVTRKRPNLGYAVVASYSADAAFVGRNIYEIAQIRKLRETHGASTELLSSGDPEKLPTPTMEEQYQAVIDICRHGGASCVFHSMAEEEVEAILRCPLVAVASDSSIRDFGSGQPHPRGYGTNARVLGHYVRERNTIPLADAIRKMTSLPATAFRFGDRGLLRVGYVADLTLFDPDTVIDKATFEKPHQYSVGIVHVIVNGYPVLRDGEMTGLLPGRPVLGPGATGPNSQGPDTRRAAGDEVKSGR
jgi:N-acyl-D-amino-acid deacylase